MDWKIIEFANNYECSNFGEIRNRKTGKIISAHIKTGGYRYCCFIDNNGKVVNKKVSRIVAQYFVPNPLNKQVVNHINFIRTDDRSDNLEWCTQRENIIHRFKNNYTYKNNLPYESQIRRVPYGYKPKRRINNNFIAENINTGERMTFKNATQASKHLNISKFNISRCSTGRLKSTSGYKFFYLQ